MWFGLCSRPSFPPVSMISGLILRRPLAALLISLSLTGVAGAQTARVDEVTAEVLPGALADPQQITGAPAGTTEFGGALTLLGRLADGETRGIDLAGDVLFRSNGGYLEALDVTNPNASTVLGRYLTPQGFGRSARPCIHSVACATGDLCRVAYSAARGASTLGQAAGCFSIPPMGGPTKTTGAPSPWVLISKAAWPS